MRALDLVATWPVGAAAAGVVCLDRTGPSGSTPRATQVLGVTGDTDRPYEWASVTKLCTALSVLVAVEEGTLALSDPAGPHGSTVAHLLAHASGLAPDRREALTLPGRRRIYSNAGYEVLAETLEARAEMPFADYLTEAVFLPLGMQGARLARGASPASGALGTLADLLVLAGELLAPTVVSARTLAQATVVAFAGIAGVVPGFGRFDPCDWGLGFEIRDAKSPHWTGARCSAATFGHFGRSGSFLWVDPEAGVACCALADRPFGPWAAAAWPELSDAAIRTAGAPDGALRG